jgi:hypothetical protein
MASAATAQGATLRGGSYAWLSRPAEQTPRGAEEWEAFLSIDGGSRYAFRITPHLNLALQRVSWLVPNVDAADARILIRIGNEKDEREVVLPLSFSIARDDKRPLLLPEIAATQSGERGVVQWAEGDRAGTRVRQVMSVLPPGRMQSLHDVRRDDSAPADSPKRLRAPVDSRTTNLTRREPEQPSNPRNRNTADDLLLKIHRQNI